KIVGIRFDSDLQPQPSGSHLLLEIAWPPARNGTRWKLGIKPSPQHQAPNTPHRFAASLVAYPQLSSQGRQHEQGRQHADSRLCGPHKALRIR
ncbi:MAG: hypothetical protein ACPHJ3_11550, partial [Rubripirellula sp.]